MRKIVIIIILLFSISGLYVSGSDILFDRYLKYLEYDRKSGITLMEDLIGDSITFDSGNKTKLDNFYNVVPDTLWIKKKRKKKKHIEGKDYKLIDRYKGVENGYDSKYYHTPAPVISQSRFIIDGLEKVPSGLYDYRILLTNMSNGDKLIWYPTKSPDEMKIHVSRTKRIFDDFIGKTFYKKQSSSVYLKIKCIDLDYWITFDGNMCYPHLDLKFSEADGSEINWKYGSLGNGFFKMISEEEYEKNVIPELENRKTYYINTKVCSDTVTYNFPFNFSFIIGETVNDANIAQKKEPYRYFSQSNRLTTGKVLMIGDMVRMHGEDYCKGMYRGKFFYIARQDIKLNDEEQAKLDTLLSCSREIRDNFFEASKQLNIRFNENKLRKLNDKLEGLKKYGLLIYNWNIYRQSEYMGGTGFGITFFNPTNKTIKYITIYAIGYNPVNDKVYSKGKYIQTEKCVGPISPGGYAEYEIEYMWLSDLVDNVKITSIKVEYTDGTTKTIQNGNAIMWPSELHDYLNDEDFIGME